MGRRLSGIRSTGNAGRLIAVGSGLGMALAGQPLLAMPSWELIPPPPLPPILPETSAASKASPAKARTSRPAAAKTTSTALAKPESSKATSNQAYSTKASSAKAPPPLLSAGLLRWELLDSPSKAATALAPQKLPTPAATPALNPSTGFPTLASNSSSGTGLIWELAPTPGTDNRLLALTTTNTLINTAVNTSALDPTISSDISTAAITVDPPAPMHTASGLSWEVSEQRAGLVARSMPAPTSFDAKPLQATVARGPVWELVNPGEEFKSSDLANEIEASQEARAKAAVQADALANEVLNNPPSPWIVGIGGGARIGFGEPNYGMTYGRLGFMLSEEIAMSIRPAYIFGNSDEFGEPNNQGAFQMPVTLDIWPNFWISPNIGVGLASNTDSDGKTRAMYSGGVDIRLARNVSLTLGLNYILDSKDADNRDAEAFSALYLRF